MRIPAELAQILRVPHPRTDSLSSFRWTHQPFNDHDVAQLAGEAGTMIGSSAAELIHSRDLSHHRSRSSPAVARCDSMATSCGGARLTA